MASAHGLFVVSLRASEETLSLTPLTFSVFRQPSFEPPALAFGLHPPWCFRACCLPPVSQPAEATLGSDHVPLLRSPLAPRPTEVCRSQAPYRVFPSGCMPAACRVGLPSWRSSRLQGVRSTGVRSRRLRRGGARSPRGHSRRLHGLAFRSVHVVPDMAPLMTFPLDAFKLTSNSGLQRIPSERVTACSRSQCAALAFSACLLVPPFRCAAWRRPGVRSSDASRPGNSGLPYRVFPACCLPLTLIRGAPSVLSQDPGGSSSACVRGVTR